MVKPYRRGTTLKRKLLPFASLFIALAPPIRAQDDGFSCEEHNLFIDRLGAIAGVPPLPDNPATKILATQNFSGFSKYGIDSIRLSIRFDPDSGADSEGGPKPTGNPRVAATIQAHDKILEQEIRKREGWKPVLDDEYPKLSMLLRGKLMPADSSDPGSGRPNIRLQQPETGVPIFLVKFIGIVAAGAGAMLTATMLWCLICAGKLFPLLLLLVALKTILPAKALGTGGLAAVGIMFTRITTARVARESFFLFRESRLLLTESQSGERALTCHFTPNARPDYLADCWQP